MKQLHSVVLYLITMGAVVLMSVYGSPLVVIETPDGASITVWAITDFIPLFTLARLRPDKDDSVK